MIISLIMVMAKLIPLIMAIRDDLPRMITAPAMIGQSNGDCDSYGIGNNNHYSVTIHEVTIGLLNHNTLDDI